MEGRGPPPNDGASGTVDPSPCAPGGERLGRGLDPWVVRTMSQGYKIQFRRPPPYSRVRMTRVTDPLRALALRNEIEVLLRKRAITRVDSSARLPGFYSTYFLVPKASGSLRPILDLRELNAFIKK